MMRRIAWLSALGLATLLVFFWANLQEENRSISVMGSNTMLQVGMAWKEVYQSVAPETEVTVDGRGTGTGFTGLSDGSAEMSMASRPIKRSERDRIRASHGIEPVAHVVGHRAVAVYVHPSNPVKSLSMNQLREIWAEHGNIDNWNQVGGPDLAIERRVGGGLSDRFFVQRMV